ncbi:membrane protein [Gordonia crocea]|uniref:Membrane protein n=2 Tax=Gordonia crocea TaxID=589162 RepID=A0A7I9UX20_9ACTN|nr:MMPL family transporter [Gordonia crocea]GED97330.1 membrane protein [Gordonia crocea]
MSAVASTIAERVTGKRSWWILLLMLVAVGALMSLAPKNSAAESAPDSLPPGAESARVAAMLEEFPSAGVAPAILVVTRADGAPLTRADIDAVGAAQRRMLAVDRGSVGPAGAAAPPVTVSDDGKAALATVFVDSTISGFTLNDTVKALRASAATDLPSGLISHVTGGPAFGADLANSFSGANVMLLLVTALVVAVLLIITYRSPILWLVPLIVVAIADRVATVAGGVLADWFGLTFDGSTSGITSVLVFGAGTNYALLLISRYREELRVHSDHREALREAWRRAAPAIVASNLTVVIALLLLLVSSLPSIRSLGALASCGIVIAAVFVLFVLPPALALCGRRLFWPVVPAVGDSDTTGQGFWHRIASGVAARPAVVLTAALIGMAVCASGMIGLRVGLTQTEQFRVSADSVDGYDAVSAHFSKGVADPTVVLARTPQAETVLRAVTGVGGVESARIAEAAPNGYTRINVVLDSAPASDRSFDTVRDLRSTVSQVAGADALVGGADAKELDTRQEARRSVDIVVPLILIVVALILMVLLRAVVAPLILVAVTALSALTAIGAGTWLSEHVFGFGALDTNVVLFSFLFLVALGVDYTYFLVLRAREETPALGTRAGMVRAVSVTGGVITSAGVVLAAVFVVLGILPLITLTQLGIIVALGIVIDTFLVRATVIPALFALVGPRMWWPSDLEPAPARQRAG